MLTHNILKAAPKYIFNKLTYKYNLATTIRAYNAVNMPLDEAFKTSLQNNSYKTAKLLLSSGQLDLNYKDAEGNSVLKNIVESQNTSLLNKYFSKVEKEPCAKLENSSISGAFNIALNLNDKKVVSTFLKGLTKLNNLDQLQTHPNSLAKTEKVSALDEITSSAPPAYNDINNDCTYLYPVLGETVHQE